jgi:hypothetical protein
MLVTRYVRALEAQGVRAEAGPSLRRRRGFFGSHNMQDS